MKDTDASLSFFHPGMLPSKVLFPFFIFLFLRSRCTLPVLVISHHLERIAHYVLDHLIFTSCILLIHQGKLLTDPSRPNGPTFVGIIGEFYPALSLYGTNVKLTVHTGESYDA